MYVLSFFFSSILIRAATLQAKCKWEYLNERSPLCRQRTIEKVNEARRNTEKSRHRERQAESASMKGRNLVNGSAMRLVFLLQSHAAAVLHYDHACTREREFLRDRGRQARRSRFQGNRRRCTPIREDAACVSNSRDFETNQLYEGCRLFGNALPCTLQMCNLSQQSKKLNGELENIRKRVIFFSIR